MGIDIRGKVLIIEDEIALSDAYTLILTSEGYITKTASNGDEALRILTDFSPDIILLDLRMPRVSGIEFLRRYDPDSHPDVRIIVFSNIDAQDEINKAYELGADRYMLKAWASPKELLAVVADTLQENRGQHRVVSNSQASGK